MTNMGMASVRKVHPHLFSDICVTEKGWRNLANPSFVFVFGISETFVCLWVNLIRSLNLLLQGSGRCP